MVATAGTALCARVPIRLGFDGPYGCLCATARPMQRGRVKAVGAASEYCVLRAEGGQLGIV